MTLAEYDGEASFVNAATSPAYETPPAAQGAPGDESSQFITTGMGGERHLERLTRLRALRANKKTKP